MENLIIQKLEQIFRYGYICDNCLGRQFSQLLSKMENKERGKILRKFFAMMLDANPNKNFDMRNFADFKFHNEKMIKELKKINFIKCKICDGFFEEDNIKKWKEMVIKKIKESGYEFNSFVVGTKLSQKLLKNEEDLWENVGVDFCEPIKTEINRTIGKEIEKRFKIKANLRFPDILILLDIENEDVIIKPNPLFIKGKYQKLVRGIAQTKSKRYKGSVEEIIAKPLMKMTLGKKHKFHGAGREDVDARCLGWRPFVIEIIEPKKRRIDLNKLIEIVNKTKEVRIKDLKFSNIEEVREIKEARYDKEYKVIVECDREIKKDELKKLKLLETVITQYTPRRVLRRRVDKLRRRKVFKIKTKIINKNSFELIVRCEAGLYVKELVSGDEKRTRPSVSEILNCNCKPKDLDVTKIFIKKPKYS